MSLPLRCRCCRRVALAEVSAARARHGQGRERRREIQRVGAITKLIGMLQTVSLSGAITANKMWDLVAKVMGVQTEEQDNQGKERKPQGEPAEDTGKTRQQDLEKVMGMQEQVAATLSDLAYGDIEMQDAISAAGVTPLITILRTGSKLSQAPTWILSDRSPSLSPPLHQSRALLP